MAPKWSDDLNLKFVELYKDHSCLWDQHDELYKDKNAREAALSAIAENLNIEGFGAAEVKAKIKSFRGTFNIELAKLQRSVKSGSKDVYVPTLKWFNAMKEVMLTGVLTRNTKSTFEDVSEFCEVSDLCETSTTVARNNMMIIEDNFCNSDILYEEESATDSLGMNCTNNMFATDLSEQAEIPSISCHKKRRRLEARSPCAERRRNTDTEGCLKVKRLQQLMKNEAELHRYRLENAKLALKEQELKVKILEVQLQKELNDK